MKRFGNYIRTQRKALSEHSQGFSIRKIAEEIGVEPAYLSKVERGVVPPLSEGKIIALSEVLEEDPDILLAMAGKVSSDLLKIIRERPNLLGKLLR